MRVSSWGWRLWGLCQRIVAQYGSECARQAGIEDQSHGMTDSLFHRTVELGSRTLISVRDDAKSWEFINHGDAGLRDGRTGRRRPRRFGTRDRWRGAGQLNRLHIIGGKNSGKTTLVVELVRCLSARGFRVGTIKHTHHHHELDVPGKDSHQHRTAGASPVAILSPGMTAVFRPTEAEDDEREYGRIGHMFADCDLVLVEGDSKASAPRLEVWRAASGNTPYAAADQTIAAVITDDEVDVEVPLWPRSPIEQLADRIIHLANLRATR